MESFRPDLSAKITIRCGKKMKDRAVKVASRHEMSEADTLRYLLLGGLTLSETQGKVSVASLKADPLEAKVTVRCSLSMKRRAITLARKHNIMEATIVRNLLDDGLDLAEKHGLGYVIDIKAHLKRKP